MFSYSRPSLNQKLGDIPDESHPCLFLIHPLSQHITHTHTDTHTGTHTSIYISSHCETTLQLSACFLLKNNSPLPFGSYTLWGSKSNITISRKPPLPSLSLRKLYPSSPVLWCESCSTHKIDSLLLCSSQLGLIQELGNLLILTLTMPHFPICTMYGQHSGYCKATLCDHFMTLWMICSQFSQFEFGYLWEDSFLSVHRALDTITLSLLNEDTQCAWQRNLRMPDSV